MHPSTQGGRNGHDDKNEKRNYGERNDHEEDVGFFGRNFKIMSLKVWDRNEKLKVEEMKIWDKNVLMFYFSLSLNNLAWAKVTINVHAILVSSTTTLNVIKY